VKINFPLTPKWRFPSKSLTNISYEFHNPRILRSCNLLTSS
jgi:hypothetical protein